jgi:hypothetical protein
VRGSAQLPPQLRRRSECKECTGAVICLHQRIRTHQRIMSRCKKCRVEADTLMPAGLEELEEVAH